MAVKQERELTLREKLDKVLESHLEMRQVLGLLYDMEVEGSVQGLSPRTRKTISEALDNAKEASKIIQGEL